MHGINSNMGDLTIPQLILEIEKTWHVRFYDAASMHNTISKSFIVPTVFSLSSLSVLTCIHVLLHQQNHTHYTTVVLDLQLFLVLCEFLSVAALMYKTLKSKRGCKNTPKSTRTRVTSNGEVSPHHSYIQCTIYIH